MNLQKFSRSHPCLYVNVLCVYTMEWHI